MAILPARIGVRIQILESKRTDGRYLSDVLAKLCPVKLGRIAGQDEDAARRIRLKLADVEPIAQADVEDAGPDRVNPVLRVPVRH